MGGVGPLVMLLMKNNQPDRFPAQGSASDEMGGEGRGGKEVFWKEKLSWSKEVSGKGGSPNWPIGNRVGPIGSALGRRREQNPQII